MEEDEKLEEYNFENDGNENEDYTDSDSINSSLQLAVEISKPSNVLKSLPETTKEIRNAFLTEEQIKELRHRHKTYNTLMYIRKILKLQAKEDKIHIDNRKNIFNIKSDNELKEYFRECKKSYIYQSLIKEYDTKVLLDDLKQMEEDGVDEDIYRITNSVNDIYKKYSEENDRPEYLDDVGNLAIIQNEAILSAGRQGNERYAGISSINATRDIDLKEKIKKETIYNNPLQKLIKRFR